MLQYIVVIAGLILGIVLLVLAGKVQEEFVVGIPGFILTIVFVIWLVVLPFVLYTQNQNTQIFIQQEQYLSTHTSKTSVEDAALTQKKIDLNEWLYGAQYDRKQFGNFSAYPPIVDKLQPIQ